MFKKNRGLMALGLTLVLTGCANYKADQLTMLSEETAVKSVPNKEVSVSWKTFDKTDCKTYLGRNVISEGYVPVQLTVRNNSSDPMYLNPNNFSVTVAPYAEVANKVHTSTAGRVIAWGIPGLIISPFLIPAIYDGIKSSAANKYLDADYQEKAIKERTIQSYETFNGLIFIPNRDAQKELYLQLVNSHTGEKLQFKRS